MNTGKLLLAGLWIIAAAIPAGAGASFEKQWNFRVYLDDREIGYHRFYRSNAGNRHLMTIEARFKVSFLRIPLYTYRHDNRETWDDQCLNGIAAVTDDNGKEYRLQGTANENGFVLETRDGKQVLPPCISTFSYWDKSFLDNTRLLNSQTGEYLEVSSRFYGEEMIDTGKEKIPALRYRVVNKDFNIDVWYSKNDEWLALESITESGRVLRYMIEQAGHENSK